MKLRATQSSSPGHITQLLAGWNRGDDRAKSELITLLYPQLRRVAGRFLAREAPHRLSQRTELVHDAFLRLAEQQRVASHSRAHFLALCAETMRRILVDAARRRASLKRGADFLAVPLNHETVPARTQSSQLIALDDALRALNQERPGLCRIVELRFFGGLSHEEISQSLGVSVSTVSRRWRFARAWLRHEISIDVPGLPGREADLVTTDGESEPS